ncbi:carboxymuconolactone decarboxylase family protein [Paenalkalicoccus suaedae]|uniref:Carboxymuconolactone decarboxylase family protein n=1 Tax=Paenalkalicoccus suaedae TaxID=2592382 RepID=A0A859FCI5_9BACI|nr:carboxymuconolactone decarboxylase family protein [Paenalkalicoccus suaedae]QKS70491.1 carboxymuconolactone decarboxylase family protein [Paenalkalicoccus suaedae]
MAKEGRYKKGMDTLKEMISEDTLQAISGMKDISPDFWEMIVGFGYGEVYSREGMSLAEREIVTLTTLITQGAFGQLEFHLRAARKVGLTEAQIIEIIIQCAAYVGFPKATQAMQLAGKVFEETR